jgi:hypothetical protein
MGRLVLASILSYMNNLVFVLFHMKRCEQTTLCHVSSLGCHVDQGKLPDPPHTVCFP